MLHTVHLSAHGYEADILPERGANLAALTRPSLGLSSVRTPASLESFTTENPLPQRIVRRLGSCW